MIVFGRAPKSMVHFLVMIMMTLPLAPVQAGMIRNDVLLAQTRANMPLQRGVTPLDRDRIRNELIIMGVAPLIARLRVNQMTDNEIAEMNRALRESPAGSGVVGAAVTVFLVLVFTDMLGATDVFPFVHDITH